MNRAKWNGRGAGIRCTLMLAAAVTGMLGANLVGAAVPGIKGTSSAANSFSLVAGPMTMSQPDGATLYTWGYGCVAGSTPAFVGPGASPATGVCPTAQIPGPTLVVTQGQPVTVTLTNNLPAAAGNTSIVFAGQTVTASGGVAGSLTAEAAAGNPVTYTFTPAQAGTYAYYSGSQADLQIEMGLYGALIVVPASQVSGATCTDFPLLASNALSLGTSAYANANTCYDREYLFQFHEMTSSIHDAVKAWVTAGTPGPIAAKVEPYQPNYFMINGRSLPDDLDSPYSPAYPNQPYNGNPHMHPNEQVLIRVIGQGRIQHPFHIHGNHARVLGRDGNLILSQTANSTNLAGPLEFTIPTVSGQAVDAIFTWSGKGLNWDVYGHTAGDGSVCVPDNNGFYTSAVGAKNYGEYCADHTKPIPVTPPDPNIVANGQWYGGTPYLGIQANNPTPQAPGVLKQNTQAGYAYMWHSHDEREITTNNVFPGGMMMMLIIDAPSTTIDETQ